jgi:hypothetical protein
MPVSLKLKVFSYEISPSTGTAARLPPRARAITLARTRPPVADSARRGGGPPGARHDAVGSLTLNPEPWTLNPEP